MLLQKRIPDFSKSKIPEAYVVIDNGPVTTCHLIPVDAPCRYPSPLIDPNKIPRPSPSSEFGFKVLLSFLSHNSTYEKG